MRQGKNKLQIYYYSEYQEWISTWKIECVIRKHNLFPNPLQVEKLRKKRKKGTKKKRIQELALKPQPFCLFHLDTILIYWGSVKRYILTALDHHTRVAYARMYTTKSSRSAKDFLTRLHYLINGSIPNIHTDNGSEFAGEFEQALKDLETNHWFSRERTPTDNARLESFNGTLQREWLNDGNFTPTICTFNKELTEWLIEYNFQRPHQSLGYMTPFRYYEVSQVTRDVLPMSSASTTY